MKSRGLSLILTLLFGPLGLLYASIGWALFFIILAIVTAPTIIGPIICWVMAIAVGDHIVYKQNQAVDNIVNTVIIKTKEQ